jgi:hypothetical protein
MAGEGLIWALRMPGGPTRVVRSKKPISEDRAKQVYSKSFNFKSAQCLLDKEAIWPLCKSIDETEFAKSYSQFAELNSRTGRPRGLVEV